MGFFKKFIPKEIRKPVAKALDKFVPNELKPALPFLAAATPFLLPTTGIFSSNLMRALASGSANVASQLALDPEGDLNDLSILLAAGSGALTGPKTAGNLRSGIERGIPAEATMARGPAELGMTTRGTGFFQGAENIGREGLASLSDYMTGARDTLANIGKDPGSLFDAGVKGARFPELKAAAKAVAPIAAQGTGDLAYATASAALREFNAAEAAELAQAGMDEAAIANARRIAIREAMEVSGFTEEDILETFDEIGLKDGGRVGYKTGKLVKEGLGALKLFRRPKYRFEDEAKMTLDLTKTGRYTEKQLLELDGDQIAEIYEYEGFTPPAPIEGSTKIIDMEEIMENIKNVTPEDKADGGITGLKDGGMLDFGGREMDLRGGGFVPIGKKEKADDVPARLSKNEFVMTADAVRAAGGGSVNKGAQRMYDLMNNLEARA